MAKSWKAKFYLKKELQIKIIQKSFWGQPAGSKMLIPTPLMILEYINHIESGNLSDIALMRNDLAIEHNADFTCPLTTGIFLRIVAEYNYVKLSQNDSDICPFWRIIDPKSKLSDKLSFHRDFIIEKRMSETKSRENI